MKQQWHPNCECMFFSWSWYVKLCIFSLDFLAMLMFLWCKVLVFFALRDYLEPVKELYSSSFRGLCLWIYSGGLTLLHQKVQLHLVPPFSSADFSRKTELSHSHSCNYNLIKEKLTHCFDPICYYLVSVW